MAYYAMFYDCNFNKFSKILTLKQNTKFEDPIYRSLAYLVFVKIYIEQNSQSDDLEK